MVDQQTFNVEKFPDKYQRFPPNTPSQEKHIKSKIKKQISETRISTSISTSTNVYLKQPVSKTKILHQPWTFLKFITVIKHSAFTEVD